MITATNWTACVYAQLTQAALVKAKYPNLPVYVRLSKTDRERMLPAHSSILTQVYAGFGNADGFNAATFRLTQGASAGCRGHQPCRKIPQPYTDWFLETETVPVYSMSGCEQMGLGYSNPPTERCWNAIWNVANPAMRDYFIDHLIKPLVSADLPIESRDAHDGWCARVLKMRPPRTRRLTLR